MCWDGKMVQQWQRGTVCVVVVVVTVIFRGQKKKRTQGKMEGQDSTERECSQPGRHMYHDFR